MDGKNSHKYQSGILIVIIFLILTKKLWICDAIL